MIIYEPMLRETLMISEQTRDSYLLYGSFARGDYEPSSDIDVLRITTRRMRAPRNDGRALLHIYDIRDLLRMAKRGDLFILHLVREAKPIHDPCGYLPDLSATFHKPESYLSEARRKVGPASAILEIKEGLFKTAPTRFMEAAIFLCRTLLYAEHADHGAFSFSLRVLATTDETAAMINNMRHRAASYFDFQLVRNVVLSKLEAKSVWPEASSMSELYTRNVDDQLLGGLLKRIVGKGGDPYMVLSQPAAEELITI